ncbi:MAG: sugar nucleotide-binding protein [Alphaproteobacteria bacterium]|nr:sugar nucleotide-binding protein [Alphaproteobacteria bacterium]
MRLFAFGAGGCLLSFAESYPEYSISATYRDDAKRPLLLQAGITPILFDDKEAVMKALLASDGVIISAPPLKDKNLDENLLDALCDPSLIRYGDMIQQHQAHYCYLSTTGIYGNHDGAWVDEQTMPNPQSLRAKCRLHAEQEWQEYSKNICILRLAGIYGNQRNVLKQLHTAPPEFMIRKINDGRKLQTFSRIHEIDIAQAIHLSLQQKWQGIYNLCDDEPAPPEQPFIYAASLLGINPPPIKDYDDIIGQLSPMQKSFYCDDKKVSNDKIKQAGLKLRYPNYRAGLDAIYQHHFGNNLSDS